MAESHERQESHRSDRLESAPEVTERAFTRRIDCTADALPREDVALPARGLGARRVPSRAEPRRGASR